MKLPIFQNLFRKENFPRSICQYGFDKSGNYYRLFPVTPQSAIAGLSEAIRSKAGVRYGFSLSPSAAAVDDDSCIRDFASAFSLLCGFSKLVILDFSKTKVDLPLIRDLITGAANERICLDDNNVVFASLPDFYNNEDLDFIIDTVRMNNLEGIISGSLDNIEHIISTTKGRVQVYARLEDYDAEKALKMLNIGGYGLIFMPTDNARAKISNICSKCLKELKSE